MRQDLVRLTRVLLAPESQKRPGFDPSRAKSDVQKQQEVVRWVQSEFTSLIEEGEGPPMGDALIKPPTTRQGREDERDRDQGGEGGVIAPVRPMSASSTSTKPNDTAITAVLPNVRRSKRTRL